MKKTKRILAVLLTVVMMLTMVVPAMAAPVGETGFAGDGDKPVAAKQGQASVYKDGEVYDPLETVYSGNSSANHGYKISANKSYNTISLDGVDVGYFTFDKKGNGPKSFTDFLTINITNDDYVVDVRWDCSKYYAYASLDGIGTYLLPQLMQDNGKIQSFDQIWIAISKKATPPPVEVFGSLSIQKTIGGVPFGEWAAANELTMEDVEAIIDGMKFTAYLLEGENGARVAGKEYPGAMFMDGVISFGADLPIGWYEVVEEISGTAENYFVGEGGAKVYYVGEDGVSVDIVNIISGREDVGVIVSHDGTGVNWKLPDVWNGQLGSDLSFQKLMGMGAQWIWDKENTYEYGIDGSVVKLDFTVDVAEETTAPIYFAADNAAVIYVNGKLAAQTTVAFADRSIPPTITEDTTAETFFDSLASDQFDGRWAEGWSHVYGQDITLEAGENTITIFAANSASKGYYDENGNFVKGNTGTDNDSYNLVNNPCGLIFGFQLPGATFDNTPLVDTYTNVYFTKTVYGDPDADYLNEFAFELFQYNEDEADYVIPVSCDCQENDCDGYYYADYLGIVYAENLSVGKYVFKEVDNGAYAPRNYEDGLYFEIVSGVGGLETVWDIESSEDADGAGNPIVVNMPTLGALEVNVAVTLEEITTFTSGSHSSVTVGQLVNEVANSNGCWYAAINVDDAANGITFNMYKGSSKNPTFVGTATVKKVNDELVVTINDFKSGKWGALAFSEIPEPENGNIHSKGYGFDHDQTDSTVTIMLPEPDVNGYVYLYVHCNPLVFEKTTTAITVPADYDAGFEFVLYDADGEVVNEFTVNNNSDLTIDGLLPGVYTLECIELGYETEVTIEAGQLAIVAVEETDTKNYSGSYTPQKVDETQSTVISTVFPRPSYFATPGRDVEETKGDTIEPGDTVEPGDTIEPGDTAGPGDTAEPGDATELGDATESGDVDNTEE